MREPAAGTVTPFSFGYICDALGLDARALRRQLHGWRERQRRAGDAEEPFTSSKQRCRWRAVHRETVRAGAVE